MRRILPALAVMLAAARALAWPVLDERRELAGLYCYPDHEDPALWWYLEPRVRLFHDDAGPAFHFERYVYTGTALSGDAGQTWGRGVLSLTLDATTADAARSAARSALERETAGPVTLRAAPVERIAWSLQHVSAGEEKALSSGSLTGEEQALVRRRLQIGMDPHTTGLLWSALHADSLALSLAYEIHGPGLATRQATRLGVTQSQSGDASTAPGELPVPEIADPAEPGAVSSRLLVADSTPIRVDPVACPACFSSTDLQDLGRRGYPLLHVWCGLFELERDAELERMVVEVRASDVDGKTTSDRLVCRRRDGGGLRSLELRRAVSLDRGYAWRVVRVLGTGEQSESAWHPVASWVPLLDATLDPDAAEAEPEVAEPPGEKPSMP